RARFGVDLASEARTPLVGRERELEQLVGALERARQQRSPELVTLIGVPGIGKSRLVAELFQSIERGGVLTYWRQGRSLPYGAGDFVEHLVDWVRDVPMLILCTARLELLERRPAWGGGKVNAATVALAPLSDEETAKLIAALSDRPLLEAEVQSALLDRAGGNPLYAEQYVRMLAERGTAEDLPLPESVQGIIAARL